MRTVDKAMTLMGMFSRGSPEIGLSDLASRAKFDKATTHRLLASLAKHGLVEQNLQTKKYHLGPSVLRLAILREATVPMEKIVEPAVRRLVEVTGETSCFNLVAGDALSTACIIECPQANRVILDRGGVLPFHGTASGIAVLAFLPPQAFNKVMTRPLGTFTKATVTDKAILQKLIDNARRTGIGVANQSFENDVHGVAAPVFNTSGIPIGAVAVLTPASRVSRAVDAKNREAVLRAAIDLTRAFGAQAHPNILKAAANFSKRASATSSSAGDGVES